MRGEEDVRLSDRGAGRRTNLLSVVVEDYFHVAPLKSVVQTEQWYRFERRVEANTKKALDLLEDYGIRATFFVLGSIADEMPDLVREVAGRGHEIASKGYIHRSIRKFSSPSEFRDDLLRSREALENASGSRVSGYRIGHGWFSPDDLWALEILAEEGFSYDSSVRPLFRRYAAEPWRCYPHLHKTSSSDIWEFPLAAWTVGGWSVPISGGNYFRQFPHWLMRRIVRSWMSAHHAPFLMYFHVWELDPDQPRIRAAPLFERIRQYRNLDKMADVIRYYLGHYSFSSISEHLGLSCSPRQPETRHDAMAPVTSTGRGSAEPRTGQRSVGATTRVSIVIPCFNEELILPYLANTLKSVENELGSGYDLSFVFVDDGSTDGTWDSLHRIFGDRTNCAFIRHPSNLGVAAAIMTGIRAAEDDIACSIDCDCTYDPHQLQLMIPRLTDGVDMVTASPYHQDGLVRNVPQWRLFLSKSLSRLYRVILNHQLATYTSCFRVYRRQSVEELRLHEGGFLGVAEMLGLLDLQGGRIIEQPAVLEVRLLGRSKMKTIRTIAGHLRLLARLGLKRLLNPRVSMSSRSGGVKPAVMQSESSEAEPRETR